MKILETIRLKNLAGIPVVESVSFPSNDATQAAIEFQSYMENLWIMQRNGEFLPGNTIDFGYIENLENDWSDEWTQNVDRSVEFDNPPPADVTQYFMNRIKRYVSSKNKSGTKAGPI